MESPSKIQEIADRYNILDRSSAHEVRLRVLEQDAFNLFVETKHAMLAMIVANLRFELGNIESSLNITGSMIEQMEYDPQKMSALQLYFSHARSLFFSGKQQEALSILDKIHSEIPRLGKAGIGTVMNFYANAQEYEKLLALNQISSIEDKQSGSLHVFTSMLAYFIHKNEEMGLIKYFMALSSAFACEKVGFDDVDPLLDRMSKSLLYPRIKPSLSQAEVSYLFATREIMLEFLDGTVINILTDPSVSSLDETDLVMESSDDKQ